MVLIALLALCAATSMMRDYGAEDVCDDLGPSDLARALCAVRFL